MASTGLLALLDDIATLLDDVSVLTKTTASKTAGVLGDDLALNAQQVSGVRAERELPVVWAVAKGSAKNKAILVPAALLLSAFAPWVITPLLMLGGGYLCYEGFEKVAEKLWHSEEVEQHKQKLKEGMADPNFDLAAFEREKIKGAIRTDLILSAEIVVIALGIVQGAALPQQILTLVVVAVAITVGVYGLVAAIVKLDDLGLYWIQSEQSLLRKFGKGVLATAPLLMKFLSIAGTAAMFLVGGGILVHNIPAAHHALEYIGNLPALDYLPMFVTSGAFNAVAGILTGAAIVAVVTLGKRLRTNPAD